MKTIVCYGDSNTYGYDPRSFPEDRYKKSERWTGILDEALEDQVLNYGVNGRCIPHTKNQVNAFLELICALYKKAEGKLGSKDNAIFVDRIEDEKKAVLEVWIMLGTNDLLQNPKAGAKGVAERMKHFLAAVFQEELVKSGKILIRLLAPAHMSRGSWVGTDEMCEESKRIGDYYEELAGEFGIPCIRTDQVEIPLLYDGVHFTKEGHRNLAKYLL